MRKLITILLLFISLSSYGQSMWNWWNETSPSFPVDTTKFYVSSSTGSDLNDGLTTYTPFETFSHAYSVTEDGDGIFLLRGDTFTYNDTIQNAIEIDAYGLGNAPLFDGLDLISGFDDLGGNVYGKPITSVEPLFMIFNDTVREKGGIGEVNLDLTFLTLVNTSGDWITTTATSDTLASYSDLVGAEIVIKLNKWAIGNYTILTHVGNTITFDASNTTYKPAASAAWYFLQNDEDIFSNTGDWAYRNDSVFVYSTDAITNHTVEIPTIQNLFTLPSGKNVAFRNIDIKGISDKAILITSIDETAKIEIENINAQYCTNFASAVWGIYAGYCKIESFKANNVILTDIFDAGYKIGSFIDTLEINGGGVQNEGLILGYGKYNKSGYNGVFIYSWGQEATFANMTISDLGYNGISGAPKNRGYVYNNVIKRTNYWLDDGAGIHIGENPTDTIFVYNNIIEEGMRGIYLDYGASNFQVYNNTVTNSQYSGLYSNDLKTTDIYNNNFFNCIRNVKFQQFGDSVTLGYMYGVNFYNNVTFMDTGFGTHIEYALGELHLPSADWSDTRFGKIYENVSISTDSLNDVGRITGGHNTSDSDNPFFFSLTFPEWQAKGYDSLSYFVESAVPTIEINETADTSTVYFTGIEKQTPDYTWYTDSIVIPPYSSVIFIDSIGVELITNGDFASATWWNDPLASWTISGGVASFNSTSYLPLVTGSTVLESGKTFIISFDINVTSGTLEVCSSDVDGSTFSSLNSYSSTQSVSFEYTQVTSPLDYICFLSQTSFNGYIDNVSVREKY